jgi:hypothetical protein
MLFENGPRQLDIVEITVVEGDRQQRLAAFQRAKGISDRAHMKHPLLRGYWCRADSAGSQVDRLKR